MKARALEVSAVAFVGLRPGTRPSDVRGASISPSRVPGAIRAIWFDGLFWFAVTDPMLATVPNLISGFAWTGFDLASFQCFLQVRDAEHREAQVALYHTCEAAVMFVPPFAGGLIADLAGYYVLFAVWLVARIVAAIAFTWGLRSVSQPEAAPLPVRIPEAPAA